MQRIFTAGVLWHCPFRRLYGKKLNHTCMASYKDEREFNLLFLLPPSLKAVRRLITSVFISRSWFCHAGTHSAGIPYWLCHLGQCFDKPVAASQTEKQKHTLSTTWRNPWPVNYERLTGPADPTPLLQWSEKQLILLCALYCFHRASADPGSMISNLHLKHLSPSFFSFCLRESTNGRVEKEL